MRTLDGSRPRDRERVEHLVAVLERADLDAFLCALPKHVVMLTGYWPVVGLSLAVVTRQGWVGLLAPEDERDLAERSWADRLTTFEPTSLHRQSTLAETVRGPLEDLLRGTGVRRGRLGIEMSDASESSTYAASYRYGDTLVRLVRGAAPEFAVMDSNVLLDRCASVKTPDEIEQIERAARVAVEALAAGRDAIQPGAREIDVANAVRAPLSSLALGRPGVERAEGFAYCMSGPNAARAYASHARSRTRAMAEGELTLVHVNSTVDGHWTDLTRTWPVGEPTREAQRVLHVLAEARLAALDSIRPGVRAREVDAAARRVLSGAGYGEAFRHSLGHGVGFTAFDHAAHPVLSPTSEDVLQVGMVFNVEPAVYLEGLLGARHCDMVTVTSTGCRVLSP